MATTPREKAKRCFALARSTTFAGEREAAISRGVAICEAASLDLDEFDIPGRPPRAKSSPAPISESFAFSPRRPDEGQYTVDEIRDLMRGFHQRMSGQYRR